MNFRYLRVVACVAMLIAGNAQALDMLGAIADSAKALSEATNEINELVNKISGSVGGIEQRAAALGSAFQAIASTQQPQVIVKTTFGAIDNALAFQDILMPLVKELVDVVAVISSKLLPAIGRFPGVPSDVAKAGQQINNVVDVVNKVKAEIAAWGPKIRQLSTNIGGHVLGITQQVEGTVADIKKIF